MDGESRVPAHSYIFLGMKASFLVALLAAIALATFFFITRSEPQEVGDFGTCAAAGNRILESYPRQCVANDGQRFVEDVGNSAEKTNLIRLDAPRPNEEVASPITLTGAARGYWFFEASFPIAVVDWDGKIIGEGFATAQSEWMTGDFVPFTATITFRAEEISGQYARHGALILKRDNPSGLPENDDALEVPVRFR